MAGEFEKLIYEEGLDAVREYALEFEAVIWASFKADQSKPTPPETKRRFNMCADIFRTLRGDLKWSKQRIFDELPKALRCKLDNIPWTPSREGHGTWGSDGNRIWLPD